MQITQSMHITTLSVKQYFNEISTFTVGLIKAQWDPQGSEQSTDAREFI